MAHCVGKRVENICLIFGTCLHVRDTVYFVLGNDHVKGSRVGGQSGVVKNTNL